MANMISSEKSSLPLGRCVPADMRQYLQNAPSFYNGTIRRLLCEAHATYRYANTMSALVFALVSNRHRLEIDQRQLEDHSAV